MLSLNKIIAQSRFRLTNPFSETLDAISKYTNLSRNFLLKGSMVLLASFSVWSYYQAKDAEDQIAWRKSQLALPVLMLRREDMANPPWLNSDKKKWLYRRILTKGRLIYSREMNIPYVHQGVQGYIVVYPAKTEGNDTLGIYSGFLYSKGFVRKQNVLMKGDLKECYDQQLLYGFLSDFSTHSKPKGLFAANAYVGKRESFSFGNLHDMAQNSHLTNADKIQNYVLEGLSRQGELDQNMPQHFYTGTINRQQPYPYVKTVAGALQLAKMPWEYYRDSKIGAISCLLAYFLFA